MRNKKPLMRGLSASILLLLLCLRYNASSQNTPSAIKEILYDNLQLKDDLPYQQAFKIKGDRSVNLGDMGNADAGVLSITGKNSEGKIVTSKFYWWKKSETDTDFEFFINQGLLFGEPYALKFEFYQQTDITDLKNKLKQRLLVFLEEQYSQQGGLSISKFDQALQKVLGSVGTLTIDKGEVKLNSSVSSLIENISIQDLLRLIQKKVVLKLDQRTLEELKSQIHECYLTMDQNVLNTYVTQHQFVQDDLNKINDFISNFSPLSQQIITKIDGLPPVQDTDPTFKTYVTLKSISSLQRNFTSKTQAITDANTLVNNLNQNFVTSIDNLNLQRIYSGVGSASIITAKTEDINITNVVGTRFTAVAGTGVTALNLHLGGTHGPVEYQPFSYFAVKYQLTKVDKRVSNPYLEPNKLLSRWSLIGGWKVGGDLTFQGRALSTVIGINPVVGVSYDFTKYISVDFLGIFYKQQSINPFDTNPRLGLAPCVTLSADFDLINRLKTLFSNKPYTIQTPNSSTNK